MPLMTRRLPGAAFLAAMPLLLPAVAAADLPQTSSTRIVPGESIAGVRTTDTFAKATARWGGSEGEDCFTGRCDFDGTAEEGRAVIAGTERRLSVSLELGFLDGQALGGGASKPNLASPLAKYKTSKGIHLGSTVTQLRRAYGRKKLERRGVGVGQGFEYVLTRRKNRSLDVETTFFPGDGKRITVISISVVPHASG